MVVLEQEEALARLDLVVSLVRMVSEGHLVTLVAVVILEDQDSLGHPASLASKVLRGSNGDHQAGVVVQVHRASLVRLVMQDSRAIEEDQVYRERLVQRAQLVVLVSMSVSY